MINDKIVCRNLWSPVGDMIAGATDHGVCFLEWHSRGGVERIRERVQKRHHMQVVSGNNDHLEALERNLGDYFDGSLRRFHLALDYKGTAFEQSVWKQLLAIPYGETRSYSQIAVAIGKPKAVRAVGRANGANYISILVPCHRVIEASGKLRGYGGGLWRKKYLLELERGRSSSKSTEPANAVVPAVPAGAS
jgi:AraC family transcriptional regulator of adaptative response/methylated-DNA-[protein]-cysteine methyltransferase